jgi:hypothetical protein
MKRGLGLIFVATACDRDRVRIGARVNNVLTIDNLPVIATMNN